MLPLITLCKLRSQSSLWRIHSESLILIMMAGFRSVTNRYVWSDNFALLGTWTCWLICYTSFWNLLSITAKENMIKNVNYEVWSMKASAKQKTYRGCMFRHHIAVHIHFLLLYSIFSLMTLGLMNLFMAFYQCFLSHTIILAHFFFK
jgi:hypothetical protein